MIAAVLAFVGGVSLYLDRTVFDSDAFADRATTALEDPDVRAFISERVTDQAVKVRPDLVGVRPVIGAVADGIIRSTPFRALFRAGATDLHRSVFTRDSTTVSLAVSDVGVLVIQALERISPAAAKRVPPNLETQLVRISDGSEQALTQALQLAEGIHFLAVACLSLAALLLVAGVLLAPDRRRVFGWIGLGAVGAGLATVLLFTVAGLLVTHAAEDGQPRDAARAVWDVYLGDLRDWGVLVAVVGAVVAGASASLVRPMETGPMLRAGWARVSATPSRPLLRVARALALIVAGGLVIAGRDSIPQLLILLAGIALMYVGVAEVMRMLAPPEPEVPAHRPRRRFRVPRPAVAAGLVLLALVAAVFTGRALQSEDATATVTACNGHRELCNRRVDDVTFASAHNAMSAATEPGWLFATHEHGIRRQLDDGVRALLIDTHYGVKTDKGVATDLEAGSKSRAKIEDEVGPEFVQTAERLRRRLGYKEGEGKREIYLCHAYCEVGATKFQDSLEEIRDFVIENPGEVVVLSIEDDVSPKDTAKIFKDSGLLDYVYDGPMGPRMPTLRGLIDRGQPVLVYSENKTDRKYPWYHQQFGYVQETPFDFKTTDSLLPPESCKPMRGRKSNPLFLLNHWVETAPAPRPSNAKVVNSRKRLLERAQACAKERGLKPNLVAVDFYATGDLEGVVDELNGVS